MWFHEQRLHLREAIFERLQLITGDNVLRQLVLVHKGFDLKRHIKTTAISTKEFSNLLGMCRDGYQCSMHTLF